MLGDRSMAEELVQEVFLKVWRSSGTLLDASHREVIDLAYFGGLSQREISERTGVPLGTVKTRTASAYNSLRQELAVQDTSREAVR